MPTQSLSRTGVRGGHPQRREAFLSPGLNSCHRRPGLETVRLNGTPLWAMLARHVIKTGELIRLTVALVTLATWSFRKAAT